MQQVERLKLRMQASELLICTKLSNNDNVWLWYCIPTGKLDKWLITDDNIDYEDKAANVNMWKDMKMSPDTSSEGLWREHLIFLRIWNPKVQTFPQC